MIPVFDGHSDILSDVTEKRKKGGHKIIERYHLERLRAGGTEGGIFVIWIEPPYTGDPWQRTEDIMRCAGEEFDEASEICVVRSFEDIEKALSEGKFYVLLGIEGLSAIGDDVEKIDEYYEFGCRHAMLSWNEENELATGVLGDPLRGLTETGRKAVKKIYDKKMIMDVSHLNEKSFWDLMGCAAGPVVASHSNSKALCGAKRNLSDEQLREIGKTGGLVGINSFGEFVDDDPGMRTVDRVAEHIIYISELIGVEHVGCGFDFFEFLNDESLETLTDERTPAVSGMEDSSVVQDLFLKLKEKGMSEKELEMIAYKNWHGMIRRQIG